MLQRASALAYIFRGDTINAPLVSYPRQNAQPPPSHTLFGRPRRLLNSRVAVMLSRALTTAFRRPCSTQTLRTTLRTRTQHIHTPTCSCVRPTLSTFRAQASQQSNYGIRDLVSGFNGLSMGGRIQTRGMKVRSSVKKLCDGCKVRRKTKSLYPAIFVSGYMGEYRHIGIQNTDLWSRAYEGREGNMSTLSVARTPSTSKGKRTYSLLRFRVFHC